MPRFIVIRWRLLAFKIALAGLVLSCGNLNAASIPPPPLPRVFDSTVVHGLIDNIEADSNLVVLKYGYFVRRANRDYPPGEGYQYLKAQAAKEPRFTKRWFLLQSAVGFASFRVGSENIAAGLSAYQDMSGHAELALNNGALPVVERALVEFTFSVYEFGRKLSQPNRMVARKTLVTALKAHLFLINHAVPVTVEPLWREAGAATDGAAALIPVIEDALKNGQPPPVQFYHPAVAILGIRDPQRALDLLTGIKGRVQPDNVEQLRWFYGEYVEHLLRLGRLDEAIVVQRECAVRTGSGFARLAELHYQHGLLGDVTKSDQAAIAVIVAKLSGSNSPGTEIVGLSQLLLSWHQVQKSQSDYDGHWQDLAGIALTGYLSAGRQRELMDDFMARMLLARLYLDRHQVDEAGAVLRVNEPTTSNPRLLSRYRQLVSLRDEISRAPQ